MEDIVHTGWDHMEWDLMVDHMGVRMVPPMAAAMAVCLGGGYGGSGGGYGRPMGMGMMGGYGMNPYGGGPMAGNWDPNDPNGPPAPPSAWQAMLAGISGVVHFFGRLSFLVDENAHAVHFFISALLQLLDRFGSLYGELARFVLRLLGFTTKDKGGKRGQPQTGKEGRPAGPWDDVWSSRKTN